MPSPTLDRVEQQNALLDEWVAVRAEINRAEARAAALLAERAVLMEEDAAEQPQHRDAIWRSMIAEYSAAGHSAKGSIERAFTDAQWLATDTHAILRASFQAGNVTAAHARIILEAASPVREAIADGTVTPETMGLYDTAAVVFAEREAPARTRAHAREVAAALAGLTINDRHTHARDERTVTVKSVGDGMALLQILLPEHLAVAILDRLTKMARHQKQHPEDRTPTLPTDDDALDEILHNNPDYIDAESDHETVSAGQHDGENARSDAATGINETGSVDDTAHTNPTDTAHGATDEDDAETTRSTNRTGRHHDETNPTSSGTGISTGTGTGTGTSTDVGSTETSDSGRDVIFGNSDTFTRDPFHAESPPDGYYYDGLWVPPDDPFTRDPDAYREHVEQMITSGPTIIHIPTDPRTLDQIRTDLLTDLLLCADLSEVHGNGLDNITATLHVTIAATTLVGADDRPAQLDGHGELHPDTARHLAGMATGWTRLFTDSTGMVTETDNYTPTAGMKRHLRARDQHCRFPGCRMPTHRTEIDHNHDHALGGRTSIDNLAHLCKTHHALKHPDIPDEHRWTAHQLPNHDIDWTSPTGRHYTDTPPRRVMFTPTALTDATATATANATTATANATTATAATARTTATATATASTTDHSAWYSAAPDETPASEAPF